MKHPQTHESSICGNDGACHALLAIMTAVLLVMVMGLYGQDGKFWASACTPSLKVQGR